MTDEMKSMKNEKRRKRQMKVRWGKVDVLLNYWDKMVGRILTEGSKKKDLEEIVGLKVLACSLGR